MLEGAEELPLCDIVILNYNGKEYTENCIRSLTRLDYDKSKINIILVDDGSSDNSVEYFRTTFPGVLLGDNRKKLCTSSDS